MYPTVQDSTVESRGVTISPETLEWIVQQIEQRILDDLDRRGMRHNPGVF